MNEEQIIDFLITQSEILGLSKENCPYYQIIEFIAKDKEKILKYEVVFYNLKNNLYKLIEEELPDDEICDCCSNVDVNRVRIKQKLLELLEEE